MKRHIVRWPLERLKPHPRQASLFSDLDDQAFKDLVEDIKIRGLQKPVEVLPDGTIICGHQRWRAAKALDWKEIAVWIRDDLAEKGDSAVEQYLITDNLHRRHLDKLDLARCYARLRDLEHKLPTDQRHSYSSGGDLRDVLAKKIGGGSGRNLERYLHLIRTPMEVQEAFNRRRISLVDAAKVAHFPADVQAEIAAAIRTGQDPKLAIRQRVKQADQPSKQKERLYKQAERLFQIVRGIRERLDDTRLDRRMRELLTKSNRSIEEMLEKKTTEVGNRAAV